MKWMIVEGAVVVFDDLRFTVQSIEGLKQTKDGAWGNEECHWLAIDRASYLIGSLKRFSTGLIALDAYERIF